MGAGLPTRKTQDQLLVERFPTLESPMGEVIRFVSKSDLERARLIQAARAIYESIFPSDHAVGSAQHGRSE
jgi:hypothetical protein